MVLKILNMFAHLKIHSIKCRCLIQFIIQCALYLHFQLDLNSINTDFNKVSLFLHESTDIIYITYTKFLGIGIDYFDNNNDKIISTFLFLLELPTCDMESIANVVKDTLTLYKLFLCNLVGIAIDNVSVMTGINNRLYTKLELDVPHLVLIKCVCHSI